MMVIPSTSTIAIDLLDQLGGRVESPRFRLEIRSFMVSITFVITPPGVQSRTLIEQSEGDEREASDLLTEVEQRQQGQGQQAADQRAE